jgi:hypothetical protein
MVYFYAGFMRLYYAPLTLRHRFLTNKDHSKVTDRNIAWFLGLAVDSAHVSV